MKMKAPTEVQLKKWAMMTEDNEHGEVRVEIAEWFQSTKEWKENCRVRDYVDSFKYIISVQKKEHYLPHELCEARCILTHSMIEDIGKFDSKIADEICSCL